MVYLLQEAHTERKYVQVKREPPPVKKTHTTGHSETLHFALLLHHEVI